MVRKSLKIIPREEFLIITNGKETEKTYFNLLKKKKSQYKIKIEHQNKDPYELVKYASRIKNNKDEYNQVWCVFDIDNFHKENKIEKAIVKAKESGVRCAISNISFEVWLLYHYRDKITEMDVSELEKELDSVLRIIKKDLDYSKADRELLDKYFIPKYKEALKNAKTGYQKFVSMHKQKDNLNNTNYPIWNWNPCTNVHLLIEALKFKNDDCNDFFE